MSEIINGVPIGDLPGIESVPDDSMLVVEFLGKAYHMPGAVLRQMIQDVLDSMGDSVDDVTEARLTAAIETVLSSGKYNGVSPLVEVLDEEDGTSVIHIIDAFGVKKYPVEVKGARNAVQYVPQTLTDAQKAQARANIGALSAADISDKENEVVIAKISGSFDAGYTVFWGGNPAPAKGLDVLVENGSIVIGVANGDLTFNFLDDTDYNDPYTVPAGTVFSYRNSTFWVSHIVDQKGEIINMTFALESLGDTWYGTVYPEQYTIYLTGDQPGRIVEFLGRKLEPREAYNILLAAANNDIPLLCYQKDAVFRLEDGSTHTPPYGTPFYYDHNTELLHCEHDGYECTLYVDLDDYKATAEKNTPYKTAESKADDLKEEDGTIFLLSAGEPIGEGVPIPTGDSNVFVADYDTTTFAEIKAAHDAGKVCFVKSDGMPFCQLLGIDDSEAIFIREINDTTDYKVTFTSAGGKDFTLVDKNISNVYVSGLFSAKYADIKAAYEAGKACFITYGALLCPLTVLDAEKAEFVGMLTPHIGMKGTLYADGTYNFQYVHSNAVQTVEQSLTEEKKAQARANIGALSTADVDAVLQQAKDSGRFDGEDGEDGYTPVKGKDYFDGYTPVKGKDYFDGANGKTAYAYAQDGGYTGTEAEFAKKLASESDSVFVADYDTTTFAEVKAAHNAGKVCFVKSDGMPFCQLLGIDDSEAIFIREINDTTDYKVTFTSAGGKDFTLVDKNTPIYVAQTLSDAQKAQARTNIGAAAAADIAKTASLGISNSAAVYVKISDFGSWGTGAWYQKGFAMLITSRAGEMVWVAISSDDSNTNAKAIRLLNTYSKIAAIYYSASESAVYVKANAWCNNINAHIISNINGDYVPTVAQASALPSDAVQITITEFGAGSGKTSIGDASRALGMTGSGTRPTYNGADMALSSDLSGYLPTTGIAARATSDANGNNIANTYAKVTTANDYNGEQRFKNASYCPTITDTASGIGCAFKSSRGLVNELLADKIIATASTGKIPFYSYTGASNGSMSGLTEFAYLSPGAFILRPPSGEGGQIQLEAAANDPTNTGICIDTAGGNFRIFGLQSADGTTTTGYGSVLAIHPYAKIITGGYSFDGLAAKATADGNGRNIVSTYATKDEVVTAANGSLKVTLSGTSVDKTLAQIETALNAGRHVYMAENDGQVYQLSMHMAGMMACFTSVVATSNTQVTVKTVVVYDGIAPSVFTKTL